MKPIARILFPEDHPRVRGEKSRSATRSRTATGSPPRARGEGGDISDNPGFIRITPACAGRSGFVWYSAYASGDHPRVCGEKKIYNLPSWNLGGSPPRVRGEVPLRLADRRFLGITPACAGRRRAHRRSAWSGQDHPRVCGEKACSAAACAAVTGITPACAGRRCPAARAGCRASDHPRVCGEKKIYHLSDWNLGGSPPRVRGEDCLHLCGGWAPRITPACAGRSSPSTRYIRATRDHPRVCGEKRALRHNM